MVKMTADDEKLKCPMTFEIFNEPLQLDCHHSVEAEAWLQWQMTFIKQAETAARRNGQRLHADDKLATCPTCRQKIRTTAADEKMTALVAQRLETAPELIYEQYVPAHRRAKLNQLSKLINGGKTTEAVNFLQLNFKATYLRYAKIDVTNGQTAMHLFAARGDIDGVRALIHLGTGLDQMDNDGHTPLTLAALLNDKSCYKIIQEELKSVDQKKTMAQLLLIQQGITKYLQWRNKHAPGAPTHRLWASKSVYWQHGVSGITRAQELDGLINALNKNWDDAAYKRFERIYATARSQSSKTETALTSFIDKELEPNAGDIDSLFYIQEGIQNYLRWCRKNLKGIRGLTRFNHLYHGQSGIDRAEDLLVRIDLLTTSCNRYHYVEFDKAYKRAMDLSSDTTHSLRSFIDKASDDNDLDARATSTSIP